MHYTCINHIIFQVQDENIDLEELEQFAKTFKRRRIELGKILSSRLLVFPKLAD